MKKTIFYCVTIMFIGVLYGTGITCGDMSRSVIVPSTIEGWVHIEDSSSSSSSSDSLPHLDPYDDYTHDYEAEIVPNYQDFEANLHDAHEEINRLNKDLQNSSVRKRALKKEIKTLRNDKDAHHKSLLEMQQYNALLRKQCSDVEVQKKEVESTLEAHSKESHDRIESLTQDLVKERLVQTRLQKELSERYDAFAKYQRDTQLMLTSNQNRIEYLEEELKGYNKSKALESKRQKELEEKLFNLRRRRRELSDQIAYLHAHYEDRAAQDVAVYLNIAKKQKAYFARQTFVNNKKHTVELEQLQKSHANEIESLNPSDLFSKTDEKVLCTLLQQMVECVNQNSQKTKPNAPKRDDRNQKEQAERSKQNLMDLCQNNAGFLRRVSKLCNQLNKSDA